MNLQHERAVARRYARCHSLELATLTWINETSRGEDEHRRTSLACQYSRAMVAGLKPEKDGL
jgi:hypothetical protein